MPRKHEVSIHPDKTKIDKALIKGDSYRIIAGRYGVSMTAIGRYMKSKLIPQTAKAQAVRELQGGSDLLDKLEKYLNIAEKMITAAEEYLQDPDDPNKLNLGPRAEEVEIDYTEIIGKARVKKKATLQQLLENIKVDGRIINFIRYKHEDPRRTILNAANTLTKQIEIFGRIHGDIKNVSLNLTIQPAFQMLIQNLINITAEYPEVRREIVNAIKLIKSND